MVSGIHLSSISLISIVAGFTLILIAWRGWPFQGYPGSKTWTVILLIIAFWDISYGVGLTIFDPQLRWWFDIPLYFCRAFSVPLILVFALRYTGRESLVKTKWMYGVFGFYAFAFILAVTNPTHHLMWTGYRIGPVWGAAAVDFTPRLYYLLAGISYLTILLVVIVFADMLARFRSVFGRQIISLIVALMIPTLANIAWMFRLGPTAHLDLTPFGHIIAAILVTHAMFRQRMFQVLPATRYKAEQAALDDLGPAVFSITNDGLIVNLNSRARQLLNGDRENTLLDPVTNYIQMEIPPTESSLTLTDPFGRGDDYAVAISEIVSKTDEVIGFTISFQNITIERIRQQRLTVLNRVLRHNLRNELNIIMGYASFLEQETDNPKDYATEIKVKVDELLQIGEKARTIETIVGSQEDPTSAEVSTVVRQTVEAVRSSNPNCSIELESTKTNAMVNQPVLSAVLREIIENGCEHNTADEPLVRIILRVDDASERLISITIEDNGPGIPIHELAPVREQTETALEHGSGIGLWLIDWGMSTLNGDIEFRGNNPTGTKITLRIPPLNESPAEQA